MIEKLLEFVGLRALAALVVVGFALAGLQTCRLDSANSAAAGYKASRDSARTELSEAVTANASNMTTIETLRGELKTCRTNRDADAAANAEALASLAAENAELSARAAEWESQRERDYETDPEYRAWADAPLPDALERRLRARPAGRDEDADD